MRASIGKGAAGVCDCVRAKVEKRRCKHSVGHADSGRFSKVIDITGAA